MHFLPGAWGVKPFLYAEHWAERSRAYLLYSLSVDTVALDLSYPCRPLSPPGRKGLSWHRALHNTALPNMYCALHLISTPSILDGFEHEHFPLSNFVPNAVNLEGRLPGNKTQPWTGSVRLSFVCSLPSFRTIEPLDPDFQDHPEMEDTWNWWKFS